MDSLRGFVGEHEIKCDGFCSVPHVMPFYSKAGAWGVANTVTVPGFGLNSFTIAVSSCIPSSSQTAAFFVR